MNQTPSGELVSRMHQRLEERFRELRELIRQELLASDMEQYVDLAGRVHDSGDESVADLLADVNLAVIDRHVQEVRDVDAALLLKATGANRNTLKDNLRRLVQRGVLQKTGQRRGTRYRMATEGGLDS